MAIITFLGAAQEVTGSCHMLESNATGTVLLDCGMHQGGDAIKRIKKDKFSFTPKKIDAVILSHTHLDHSGLLPKLVHQGFTGVIYCTHATAALLEIMLLDSVGLYEKDLERENLRRQRSGLRLLKPDYVRDDVIKVLKLCETHAYKKSFPVGPQSTVTFHDAGHILGSSIVEIALVEDAQQKTLVFSGDLGNSDSILMNNPACLKKADLVIMESTYGDRNHRDLNNTIDQLGAILRKTWLQGGNVFIPSFAVGRAQEILFHLGCLHHDGLLDNWQIFLDSPMAIEVTKVYDNWLQILNQEDIRQLSEVHRNSLESFLPSLKLCVTPEDSMAINRIKSGVIVIAGSGMCTGGRIRQHFKHGIWNDCNTIIFVGFQASGTLGRLLVDGVKRIRLFGAQYAVKAGIETLGGFSAHAGRTELMNWVSNFSPATRVALVHGELGAIQALAENLHLEKGINCDIPTLGERLTF
jgi:metallo-beta-lactamase family protein